MLKLKGAWDSSIEYAVGDTVVYDGVVYHLQKPCGAGITPIDTLYWGRVNQVQAQAALFALDAVGLKIGDDAISLKGDDDNEYVITIDTSGDTPEVVATVVEEE